MFRNNTDIQILGIVVYIINTCKQQSYWIYNRQYIQIVIETNNIQ
jgi:hypothetical protein